MKKHLKLLSLFALVVITVGACKKNTPVAPLVQSSCKLTQIEFIYNGISDGKVNYAYDELGRIKSYTEGTETVPYTYAANKITLTKNNDGYSVFLADNRVIKLELAGTTQYSNFSYNAEGYLTMEQEFNGTTPTRTTMLTYTNNNLTKVVRTYPNGRSSTTNNEFSAEVVSNNLMYIDPLGEAADTDLPVGYYGNLSKNLLLKTTYATSGTQYTYSDVTNYTYVKDNTGKFATKTSTGISTSYNNGVAFGTPENYTEVFKFTYECK